MMTIVVGVVGLTVYVYVARKYKLREEVNHVMFNAILKIITPKYKNRKTYKGAIF